MADSDELVFHLKYSHDRAADVHWAVLYGPGPMAPGRALASIRGELADLPGVWDAFEALATLAAERVLEAANPQGKRLPTLTVRATGAHDLN